MEAVRERADEHRRTPMIGRTHGVHAEPMTFGLKLALWYAEVQRDRRARRCARATIIAVGKISGAVGTFAHLDPAIEARRLRAARARAGAGVVAGDPARPSRRADVGAGDHRRVAREVRARDSRPAENRDRRGRGAVRQGTEGLVGDAAQAQPDRLRADRRPGAAAPRQLRIAAFENIALWHERDISHSSVERVILPDSFIALDHMLRRFTRIVRGMVVYPDRMRENLDRSRGVVFSGHACCSSWRKSGVSREQAYEWVQRNAMRAFAEQRDFKALLLADPDVTAVLSTRRDRQGVRSRRAAAQREPYRRVFSGALRCFGLRRDYGASTRMQGFVDAAAIAVELPLQRKTEARCARACS